LLTGLLSLDQTVANYEAARASARYTAHSTDSTISATVDGLGQVVALTIDQSLSSLAATELSNRIRTVINSAIDAASTATAVTVGAFASGLSLPGLPAHGQPAPDYSDFAALINQLTTQILANFPCESTDVFSCEYKAVKTTVDAQRRLVELVIRAPMPEFMLDLATQIVKSLNCAIDESTERPDDTHGTTVGIIDSKGFKDLVLYANGTLKLDDRAHVLGPSCVGFGAVANAGSTETNIGVEADVGSITSSAKVVVRDRGRVHGYILSASNVEQHTDNQIDGPIVENGIVILPTLALNVTFPSVMQGTIELEPGQQQTALPGYYNQCHPKQNAQVFLSSGVYYFNTFQLEPDSRVWINASNGPVVIYVKTAFFFRGAFLDPLGGFPRVFVGYLGTDLAPVDRAFRGTLSAPNAKINLATIPNPGYEGAFHAKDIEVQPDSRICFRPFELLYSELPGQTPQTNPSVDLGFESVAGWSGTGATLTSVANPVTQGAKSLQVTNVTGTVTIQSAAFGSNLVGAGSTRVLMDVWVPTNQPNPTNWGTLNVSISIPSAGLTNVSLGTLSITGKPQNQFSPFDCALPANVVSALSTARTDISLRIQLQITAGSGPWYLDNVRFLPPAAPPSLDPIFSFEDLSKWSSSQVTLALATDRKTHLQKSLRFANVPSWIQITSVPFNCEPINATQGKLRVDLWIPTTQPNPSWFGQLQTFVNIPSAGLANVSIGTVQLTGLAKGQFTALEFTLPANVKTAINGTFSDTQIVLMFNLPAGPGPYYLDNIRFV
jgi:DNA-binding protein YbaB